MYSVFALRSFNQLEFILVFFLLREIYFENPSLSLGTGNRKLFQTLKALNFRNLSSFSHFYLQIGSCFLSSSLSCNTFTKCSQQQSTTKVLFSSFYPWSASPLGSNTSCLRHTNDSKRCPYPNPANLGKCYFIWQRGIKIADGTMLLILDLTWAIILHYLDGPNLVM